MRVFICSYSGFSLAIPMDVVSSIFIFNDKIEGKVHYNTENRNTYISLPHVFNCPVYNNHHGIIIKYGNTEHETEDRIILVSSEIESEKEIQAEVFYPIPKTLGVFKFSQFFSGILFNKQSGKMILLLNTEHLIQNIKKEKNYD